MKERAEVYNELHCIEVVYVTILHRSIYREIMSNEQETLNYIK
jgi:hypothetical protein